MKIHCNHVLVLYKYTYIVDRCAAVDEWLLLIVLSARVILQIYVLDSSLASPALPSPLQMQAHCITSACQYHVYPFK